MNSANLAALKASYPSLSDAMKPIEPEHIARQVRVLYGLDCEASLLTGERDLNFKLKSADGNRFVLKIAHPADPIVALEAQTQAMMWALTADPELPLPDCCRTLRGEIVGTLLEGEKPRHVRLFTFRPGVSLNEVALSPRLSRRLGATAARLGLALANFSHPAVDQRLLWDLRRFAELYPLIEFVEEGLLKSEIAALIDSFEQDTARPLRNFQPQAIHNDLNPYNVLIEPNTEHISGILDFGDMLLAPRICDVAVTASYLLRGLTHSINDALDFITAYHRKAPLSREEIAVLPDLIAMRHAMTILITEWRAREHPRNRAYILRNNAAARRGLALLDFTGRQALSRLLLHQAA